jgi:hypothetical protein
MARRKQAPKDLTGIRQRGGRYQIRLFGGRDPVTGKQVMLTGSAEDEDSAIKLRDKFRRQVAEATAARTSVTLGYLLDEWLAGHQVEETTRTSYRLRNSGMEVHRQRVDSRVVLGDLAPQLRHLPLVLLPRLGKLATPKPRHAHDRPEPAGSAARRRRAPARTSSCPQPTLTTCLAGVAHQCRPVP